MLIKLLTFIYLSFILIKLTSAGTVKIQYGDDVIVDFEIDRIGFSNEFYCYGDASISSITYFLSGRWARYYIKIPLPDFLYEASIDSAVFRIYKKFLYKYSDQDYPLTINRLTEDLTEYYEQKEGTIAAPPASYHFNYDTSALYPSNYDGWIDFDLTDLVKEWLNFEVENYGFLVRMLVEESPTQQTIHICQSLFHDSLKRPILEITGPYLPDTLITSKGLTALNKTKKHLPEDITFYNYPNPFNNTTTIIYSVPFRSLIRITIYDVMGREISILVHSELGKGEYGATFDSSQFPTGIYICKYEIGNKTSKSIKLLLIK